MDDSVSIEEDSQLEHPIPEKLECLSKSSVLKSTTDSYVGNILPL